MTTTTLRRSVLLLAVSGCFTTTFAAPNPKDDVIVTATRTEQNVDNVIASVTVITREDIQRRQVQSLQEMLRGQTGIDITSQGGRGKLTSLFMRGTQSGHVLVLVDGVRVGRATAGTTSFEYVPIEQIERIEIVRGPRSSIYGSDAISGVIQIFTRRADSGVSVGVGVGSDDTYRANAHFGLVADSYWFNVTGDRYQTDGFNSCTGFSGCFTDEPDRDGYRNTSGNVSAGYRWGELAEVEFSTLYAKGKSQYDGSFQNEDAFKQIVPTLRGRLKASDTLTLQLTLGDARDDVDNFKNGGFDFAGLPVVGRSFVGKFDTEKRSGTLQADWRFADTQLLTLGGDYIDDRIDSETSFDVDHRDNKGLFAVYQGRFGAHEAELSGRYDDNEQFGSHSSGNIGWKWHLSPTLALMATYGSAFRAPTFNDLYYPGFSNPDLDPEKARSYELGVTGRLPAGRWSLNGFVTKIHDMIDLDQNFVPGNVAKARIRGIEAVTAFSVDKLDVDFNYTYLDPRDRSDGANFDNVLQRRARHSARVQAMYSFDTVRVGTEVRGQGKRYNNAANTVKLDSYVVADLLGELRIGKEWVLQAKVANVLDEDYETVRFFNEADREYSLQVRYSPSAN